MIKFAKPMWGFREREAVDSVMRRDILTNGPECRAFEEEFAEYHGGGHAVAVSSCMAALHLSAMCLKSIHYEVSALTHKATVHALDLTGCGCDFVDASAFDGNSQADVAVQFLGQPIVAFIIEDCALALEKHPESRFACYSFYPCKEITTGEGGMVLCNFSDDAEWIRELRQFGLGLSLNYRMTEIQAAIGRVQLRRWPEFRERRLENIYTLDQHLNDFLMFPGFAVSGATYCYPLRVQGRDVVRARLLEAGVETSVYYDPIAPLTPYYRTKYGYTPKDFPIAYKISQEILCLPVGPHITEPEKLAEIVKGVLCASPSSEAVAS